MKRKIAVLLSVLMLLTLTACKSSPEGVAAGMGTVGGEPCSVVYNYDAQTITVGAESAVVDEYGNVIMAGDPGKVYRYEYDEGNITIYYPNGARYWESPSDSGAVIGWDENYDPERYVDGAYLAQHLTRAYDGPERNWDAVVGMGILCLAMIALGIFIVKSPETMIYMKYSLRFRDVEPTEFALMEVRLAGIVIIAGAVILFLKTAFG